MKSTFYLGDCAIEFPPNATASQREQIMTRIAESARRLANRMARAASDSQPLLHDGLVEKLMVTDNTVRQLMKEAAEMPPPPLKNVFREATANTTTNFSDAWLYPPTNTRNR